MPRCKGLGGVGGSESSAPEVAQETAELSGCRGRQGSLATALDGTQEGEMLWDRCLLPTPALNPLSWVENAVQVLPLWVQTSPVTWGSGEHVVGTSTTML